MAQPEGDLANVASRLECVHRTAMAKNVWSHPLIGDGWLYTDCAGHMFGEDVFEARSGHRVTSSIQEQRRIASMGASGEPCSESDRCLLPKGQNALAPAFAHNVDAGWGPHVELVDSKPYQLGDPQTGGECEMQHRTIACAGSGARVGRVEKSLNLWPCERGDQRLVCLLHGYRANP